MAACALLAACAAPPLNSERIAERYGSYAVTVVRQDMRLRIASLESVERHRRVTRTLALVRFAEATPPELAAIDARIRDGASIGSSFSDAGWTIDKPLVYLGELGVGSEAAALASLMHIGLPARLAVHIYRFEVRRGDQRHRYASIVELHHPDYLDVADLQSIYGPGPDSPDAAAAELLEELTSLLATLPPDLAR